MRQINIRPQASFSGPLFFLACLGFFALRGPAARPLQTTTALSFGGTNAYVTFGQASQLGLSTFTIETWFRRDGVGQTTFTGNGGLNAIPLVTKGRAEDDGGQVDMNYFLGIDGARGVLVADFEDKQTGANHPVIGITQLRYNTWYHAAATYNGSKWQLLLNGVLEAEVSVGKAARNDSLQHAALATALDSRGRAEGFFEGLLDEVRIWNYARPIQQIRDGMRLQIPAASVAAASGLVACWELNDRSGTSVANSVSQSPPGSVRGTNWHRAEGVKFIGNSVPFTPTLMSPGNSATNISTSPDLKVSVADPEADNLIVTWYGKMANTNGADFTLIALPDTQYYVSALHGGTPEMFTAQTQWIVNNRAAKNIVYVAHLGDCVENGDNNGNTIEWERANTSLKLLERATGTGFIDGIPFGLAVGNHDQSPEGNPNGISTKLYNQYFGTPRFRARNYYGGRFTNNQEDHYQLFSAGGLDFIVIYLEYNPAPSATVVNWVDALLKTYSNRRGIVVSHDLIDGGIEFSSQGQALYEALKDNPNLFLMLCGHISEEQRRQDIFNGRTVDTLLSNYQDGTNGGNGWLRILEFSPATNQIRVKTYSPVLNSFQTDADSQFTLSYDMQGSGFSAIKSNPNVTSGTSAAIKWSGLKPNTEYEWYVTVSDGVSTVTSPRWKFKTGTN